MSEADRLHQKHEPRFAGGLYSLIDIMGMQVTCNVCGAWQRLKALSLREAEVEAERKGWLVQGDIHRCLNCRPKSEG